MKVFTIAFYFVVAIVIYIVLTRVAEKGGRLTGNVERGIVLLALIWPLWGEFAILAILTYILYKAAQRHAASESGSTEQ